MAYHPDDRPHPTASAAAESMALDPNIEALVQQLVESRLRDRTEAWHKREAEMLEREKAMNQAMIELNAKVAASEVLQTGQSESKHDDADMFNGTFPELKGPDSASRKLRPRKSRTRPIPTLPAHVIRPVKKATLMSQKNQGKLAAPLQTAESSNPVELSPNPVEPPNPKGVNMGLETLVAPSVQPMSEVSVSKPVPIKKKRGGVVKAAAQVFRYLPSEMPQDLGGLQKAITLHIRILWSLVDAKAVPQNPPSEILVKFGQQFSNEAQLYATQDAGVDLIPRHTIKVAMLMGAGQGRIASQARLVEQNMLLYVQTSLAKFGLTCWCPDLRQSAYSLYNSACRIVALDTFRQALITHTYLHLNPNPIYAGNMPVLIKLYDHFVHHYMQLRYQKECREPGRNMQELAASPQYQGRRVIIDI